MESKYPWYIIEVKSKHFPTLFKKIEKKVIKNWNFYAKPVFDKIDIFIKLELKN